MQTMISYGLFIPLLSAVLLIVNFIIAPHNPYKEKKTPFECGIHSFIDQNRAQFTIIFFLYGLAFLIFDLEILLIYPATLMGTPVSIYSFVWFALFAIALTLGFVFEVGKGALTIKTKSLNDKEKSKKSIETGQSDNYQDLSYSQSKNDLIFILVKWLHTKLSNFVYKIEPLIIYLEIDNIKTSFETLVIIITDLIAFQKLDLSFSGSYIVTMQRNNDDRPNTRESNLEANPTRNKRAYESTDDSESSAEPDSKRVKLNEDVNNSTNETNNQGFATSSVEQPTEGSVVPSVEQPAEGSVAPSVEQPAEGSAEQYAEGPVAPSPEQSDERLPSLSVSGSSVSASSLSSYHTSHFLTTSDSDSNGSPSSGISEQLSMFIRNLEVRQMETQGTLPDHMRQWLLTPETEAQNQAIVSEYMHSETIYEGSSVYSDSLGSNDSYSGDNNNSENSQDQNSNLPHNQGSNNPGLSGNLNNQDPNSNSQDPNSNSQDPNSNNQDPNSNNQDPNSNSERSRNDNQSPLDYVLEEQATELPPIYESDGGD